MTEELQKKVDRAVKLLQSTSKDQQIELCYSGGKDSDVILELAKLTSSTTTIYPIQSLERDPDGG